MEVSPVNDDYKEPIAHIFTCPGCGRPHIMLVESEPTIPAPYVLYSTWVSEGKKHVCHGRVEDGAIHFQQDCTHALAGKKVELPDLIPAFQETA